MKYDTMTVNLNIQPLFPATNPVPTIYGLVSPLRLIEPPTVTCNTSYFGAENVSLTWNINGNALAASEIKKYQYENNSANFRTGLGYNFTRRDDKANLTCSLIVENVVLGDYEMKTSAIINLYCKYIWQRKY